MSATIYRQALEAGGGRVEESSAPFCATGELEMQARWFAGEFGRTWTTSDGAPAFIEDFGRWNHEAGPDFIDARVRIGSREYRGAIEIDLDARDWERHGHAINPAFRETVAHLFLYQPGQRFFTRTCDHREVAQILLTPPAEPQKSPALSAAPEPITTDPDRARRILQAAARHRLDRKAAGLRHAASVHGEEDAWFSALAVALGYKRNQTPFLLLAQRIGLAAAAGPTGEALLFGAAGFLEMPQPPAADRATRSYLRTRWEDWWSARARCSRWILPPHAWHLAGIRPANHPHRRIAALAGIASAWSELHRALAQSHQADFESVLAGISHPFWDTRFNLQAAPLDRPHALLGTERIRDMLLNIFHPIAVDRDEAAWAGFLAESGPTPAALVRTSAERFFGDALRTSLRPAFIQQGLLQLNRDSLESPSPEALLAALRTAALS